MDSNAVTINLSDTFWRPCLKLVFNRTNIWSLVYGMSICPRYRLKIDVERFSPLNIEHDHSMVCDGACLLAEWQTVVS